MRSISISVSPTDTGAAPRPGPIARILLQWLMRSARVAAVHAVSPRFRLVELEGEALRNADWTAGQKIQVAMGSGLIARTYTPMSWDAERGRTRILAFAHGDGPGARWVNNVGPGDACQFLGPRRSLDLSGLASPISLFGDETAFGLAAALQATPQGAGMTFTFECNDAAESRNVLGTVGLNDAAVFEREPDDSHLAAAEDRLLQFSDQPRFVLAGKAASVQRIYKRLKAQGIASAHISTKAYWAEGKSGLD